MNHPMIEKAARALWAYIEWEDPECWDAAPEEVRLDVIEGVRRVLQALRDPTPDMLEAGTHQYAFQTYCAFTTEDEAAARVWTSMIDRITGEE